MSSEFGDDIDAAVAARITHDMRLVAAADGAVHARELALIAQLQSELPEGAEPFEGELPPMAARVWLRSMASLALADGAVSPAELDRIVGLGAGMGIERPDVDAAIRDVARGMVRALRGVAAFEERAIAEGVALGLTADEVAAALREP